MPSDSVSIDPSDLELLGQYKQAARQLDRALAPLERRMKQLVAQGKEIDPRMAARVAAIKGKAGDLRNQAQLKDAVKKEVKASATKHIADLLNTHNPHGRLRMLLSGNVSAGMFGDLGGGLSGVGAKLFRKGHKRLGGAISSFGGRVSSAALAVASGAFIAGKAVHFALETYEHAEQDMIARNRIESKNAGNVFRELRRNRHVGGAFAARRSAMLQGLTGGADGALAAGRGLNFYGYEVGADFFGHVGGLGKRQAERREARIRTNLFHEEMRGKLSPARLAAAQSAYWIYNPAVNKTYEGGAAGATLGNSLAGSYRAVAGDWVGAARAAGKMATGVSGAAKDLLRGDAGSALNRLVGNSIRERGLVGAMMFGIKNAVTNGQIETEERRQKAIAMAKKVQESERKKLEDERVLMFENPVYRTNLHERALQMNAVNNFEITQFVQWNKN